MSYNSSPISKAEAQQGMDLRARWASRRFPAGGVMGKQQSANGGISLGPVPKTLPVPRWDGKQLPACILMDTSERFFM